MARFGKTFRIQSPVGPVYRVDGAKVRKQHVDVIGGAHRRVPYRFVPGDEIWIEKLAGGADEERKILAHEMTEILLMRVRKWKYDRAHAAANQAEISLRRGTRPEAVFDRFLKKHFPRAHGPGRKQLLVELVAAYRGYK